MSSSLPPPSAIAELWRRQLPGSVISVSCTANCSLIAAAAVDRSLTLLDYCGDQLWRQQIDREAWATAISADGNWVAVGSANKRPSEGTIYVFDRDGHQVWRQQIGAPVWSLSFAPDGRTLVAGSWNSNGYVIRRDDSAFKIVAHRRLGSSGVYGVSASEHGDFLLFCAYGERVVLTDPSLYELASFPAPECGYRTYLTPDGSKGVVGLRDGRLLLLQRDPSEAHYSPQISQRPICGVACTPYLRLLLLGGFDGRLYLTDTQGRRFWTYSTEGEVWATQISADGHLVCVASGDHTVRLLSNVLTTAAAQEVGALEARLLTPTAWVERKNLAMSLADAFLRHGTIEYGVNLLREAASQLGEDVAHEASQRLLERDVSAHSRHGLSHYLLGQLYERKRDWQAAARHYLLSERGDSPDGMRSLALLQAGQCFERAGLAVASLSCYRRAREQQLQEDHKRVLYNLGRSHEDAGRPNEATQHYQILLTWDPGYRDVYKRVRDIQGGTHMLGQAEIDYTGLTVSLLGPDAPRSNEVDESLKPILEARDRELHVPPTERRDLLQTFEAHRPLFAGIPAKPGDLSYDVESYIKYDYLLPEDQLLKHLELLNLLSILRQQGMRGRSLDIGTATGRHPTALSGAGFAAFGVDIESEALRYARSKQRGMAPGIHLFCSDGARLGVASARFDLVTCMMGTVAHLAEERQAFLFAEARRCLRPGGLFVVSTWDTECRHLSFLSMYSHEQKEHIRRHSLSQERLACLIASAGLEAPTCRRFALLPDVFSYELGIRGVAPEDVQRLLEIDLAIRASFPQMHGQMYMIHARRPLEQNDRQADTRVR